jgi:hypothetical protein
MRFNLPTLFKTAVDFLRRKRLVPTGLGSAALRLIDAAILRRAVFSARVTQVEVLQSVKESVDGMLRGEINLAEGKLALQQSLGAMGYTPEGGFPQDAPGTVPPAEAGTLRDLRSERRKRLILETQYLLAANEAYYNAGLMSDAVVAFPAWELVRIEGRVMPRGLKRVRGEVVADPGQDWPSRWAAAGGELWDRGTRMIARKDSPVWQALGDGVGGYEDTLGNPWPPFAFNSGYGIRQVGREEALLLGVIDEEAELVERREAVREGLLEVAAPGVDDETLAWFADLKRQRARGEVERLTPSERLARLGRSASELISLETSGEDEG